MAIFHSSYATGYLCDKYHKKAGPTCNTNISYSYTGYALQSRYEIQAFHSVSDRVEIFQFTDGVEIFQLTDGVKICL